MGPMDVKGFAIGPVKVDFPVVLAPLAGYSDLAYRTLCRRQGAPYAVSEMILDRCVKVCRRKRNALLAFDDQDRPVGGQIIGNDPAIMAEAARLLAQLGVDVVDLNFACPVNKALRRRRGGWLMQEPEQVVAITRAVVEAVSVPVTVKVRRRFAEDDTEENFWRLAEGCRDVGAAGLCAHARSVERKYAGQADWDFLARVRERFPDWLVMGSGDVLSPEKALEMLAVTGVDVVLAARGAIGNPWFFRQARDLAAGREPHQPDLAEQRQVLLDHMDASVELYGPRRGPRILRKHAIKYARMHPHPKQVRMAFVEVKTPAQWREVLDRYYPVS